MRRASKVDGAHTAIVDGLRAAGYSVQSLASVGNGFFDLVVGYFWERQQPGNMLLEVKTPARLKAEARRKDRAKQRSVQAEWQGPKATVTSLEEALKVLRGEG